MKRIDQRGTISISIIVAVTMSLLFVGALVFGFWAFSGKQDYKNNADKKIDTAVEVAKKQKESEKDNQFAEVLKSPVKTFYGSATYGSVSFEYPKTYSAYVVETTTGETPVDGYFHPNVVPGITTAGIAFALRYQVVGRSYAEVLKSFDQLVKTNKITVKPFRAAKVPNTLGVRIDGQFVVGKQGSVILLPLRDKTIKIFTESNESKADFDKYVVPSISFVP